MRDCNHTEVNLQCLHICKKSSKLNTLEGLEIN